MRGGERAGVYNHHYGTESKHKDNKKDDVGLAVIATNQPRQRKLGLEIRKLAEERKKRKKKKTYLSRKRSDETHYEKRECI